MIKITEEQLKEILKILKKNKKSTREDFNNFVALLKKSKMLGYERICKNCGEKFITSFYYSYYCIECVTEKTEKKTGEYYQNNWNK